MSRDLRELLQQSAGAPEGGLDVEDLRRRGRRVQRRRQLAVAGGSLAAVAVMVVALVAGGSQLVDRPDVAVDDGRSATPVPPDVPRRTIAEGTFMDGALPWTMTANTRNQGELCLTGPVSGTCGNDSRRPDGTFLITTGIVEHDGEDDKCVAGAIDPAATAIRVAYDDGSEQTLRPEMHDEFGLGFFVECWTGPRNATSITALDDGGQALDTSTGLASTFEPPEQDQGAVGEWRVLGIREVDDAIILDLDTCNATYDIAVQENTEEVRISMTLLDPGDVDGDCLDSERIELDRPLGTRTLLLDDVPAPEELFNRDGATQ